MTPFMLRKKRLGFFLLMVFCFSGMTENGMAQSNTLSVVEPTLMVSIPAGPFLMGSPGKTGRSDERPAHAVYLDAFQIDRHEVTNAEYLRFVKMTGHPLPPSPYGSEWLSDIHGIEEKPVVQVTWYDAFAYCHWAGKRLPTEAEWEKAARGSDERLFPWGNSRPTPRLANHGRDWSGKDTLQSVGKTPEGRSFYGVEDMAGNVREWVQDWYHPEYYDSAPARNPQGPAQGILKVIRGGSWHHQAGDLRVASRGKGGFALKTDGIGFRCARSGNP